MVPPMRCRPTTALPPSPAVSSVSAGSGSRPARRRRSGPQGDRRGLEVPVRGAAAEGAGDDDVEAGRRAHDVDGLAHQFLGVRWTACRVDRHLQEPARAVGDGLTVLLLEERVGGLPIGAAQRDPIGISTTTAMTARMRAAARTSAAASRDGWWVLDPLALSDVLQDPLYSQSLSPSSAACRSGVWFMAAAAYQRSPPAGAVRPTRSGLLGRDLRDDRGRARTVGPARSSRVVASRRTARSIRS